MEDVHAINALAVVVVNGLAFLSGVAFLLLHRDPPRLYAHVLALGQVLLVAQIAVGLLLLSDDLRAAERLHYLYGTLALLAILSPWLYAPREPRRRLLWFVAASALATALSLRAYISGGT